MGRALTAIMWVALAALAAGGFGVRAFCRDGKSLGQMAKEEVNPVAGLAAMVAILAIMIILLAVLALVVVNALRGSPWGLFTIATTIPIALLMGWWMKSIRPGKVVEASLIGGALRA